MKNTRILFCRKSEAFCNESSEFFYLCYPNFFLPNFLSGHVECTSDNGSQKGYLELINFSSNVRKKQKFVFFGETNSQNVQLESYNPYLTELLNKITQRQTFIH